MWIHKLIHKVQIIIATNDLSVDLVLDIDVCLIDVYDIVSLCSPPRGFNVACRFIAYRPYCITPYSKVCHTHSACYNPLVSS